MRSAKFKRKTLGINLLYCKGNNRNNSIKIYGVRVGHSLSRSLQTFMETFHCEKYRNFTWFPGVETVPFRKISTPGDQVKLRYFSQCSGQKRAKVRVESGE